MPIIAGTSGPSSLEEITAFFASLGSNAAIVIKAMAGGGGRGMRVVESAADLAEAYARCRSEAKAAFGFDGVYAERLIRQARHIEVQIIGDRHGAISHLWERECTIQRRHQKLIEVAPSPSLSEALRGRIIEAAKQLAAAASYDNLGTFEFLVDGSAEDSFAFIEANPRLQVEHTVTEEALGLGPRPRPARGRRGRVAGLARPCARIDPEAARLRHAAPRQHWRRWTRQGRRIRPAACSPCSSRLRAPASASIALAMPATRPAPPSTRCWQRSSCLRLVKSWHDVVAKASRGSARVPDRRRRHQHRLPPGGARASGFQDQPHRDRLHRSQHRKARRGGRWRGEAALLCRDRAKRRSRRRSARRQQVPEGAVMVAAPLQGTIVTIQVREGEIVRPGQQLAVIESMKMEHLVMAEQGGRVMKLVAGDGVTLMHGEPIMYLEPLDVAADSTATEADVDLDHIRPDLAELIARQANTARRKPAGLGRAPPQHQSAHRARERRAARR